MMEVSFSNTNQIITNNNKVMIAKGRTRSNFLLNLAFGFKILMLTLRL